jgi:hypothetical protein
VATCTSKEPSFWAACTSSYKASSKARRPRFFGLYSTTTW